MGANLIKRLWNAGDKDAPSFPTAKGRKKVTGVRVTLCGAPWTGSSWSKTQPGFAFWYAKHANKLTYGTGMLAAAAAAKQPETATKCHFFSHRYANETETIRDRMIYHCGVLLEWDHGNFASVVELACMGGLGGYGGKSNWYDDKDSERTGLYSAMPDELKLPWDSSLAEVRVLDVAAKNGEEFLTYLTKYNGPTLRFLDAKIVESADVRLTWRSREHILKLLLNYLGHEVKYSEQTRNCQTFACDFFTLLAGKQHGQVEPVTTILRPMYKSHLEWFYTDPPRSE